MNKGYDAEFAEISALTFDLVEKEVKHLGYSHAKLAAKGIDLAWVESLNDAPDEAELVDAFVARFGRLQDTLGEKLFPRIAALLGESPKAFIDTLSFAERQGWITNGDDFIVTRKLRNRLVHEYMVDPEQFLEALIMAIDAATEFFAIVGRVRETLTTLGIRDDTTLTPAV